MNINMFKRLVGLGLFTLALLFGGFSLHAQEVTSAQDIDIVTLRSNSGNRENVCQCDTVTVEYFLESGNAFGAGSTFRYQFANPDNNWGSAVDLELVQLCLDANCSTPALTLADTFAIFPTLLYARLAIPCTAAIGGNTLRIVNEAAAGGITVNGISDTMYLNVGQIPTLAEISSVTYTDGSIPPENLYTSLEEDLALCQGDTIILKANTDGTEYLWYRNGIPLDGPNGIAQQHSVDSLIVTGSGVYKVEVFNGSCSIFSNDTIITTINPPTNFSPLASASNYYQIDNHQARNLSQDDSVMICADGGNVTFQAPDTLGLNGVVYNYQWLTDSIDNFGNQVYFRVDTSSTGPFFDTSRFLNVTYNNIPFWEPSLTTTARIFTRIYLTITDNYGCVDTSLPYFVWMDTVPETDILHLEYDNGVPGFYQGGARVCMDDSVELRADYPLSTVPIPTNIEFQWQISFDGLIWSDLPNANNPTVDGTKRDLMIDTSIKPIMDLTFYRVVLTTHTPYTNDIVCSYTSDSVIVRWYPEDFIRYDAGIQVNTVNIVSSVGVDSINFCEGDTAIMSGPPSPDSFNLPYQYQWFSDSIDQLSGTIVVYNLPNGNFQNYPITENGNYWVTIYDGFCTDTMGPLRAFVDSLPVNTLLESPFAGQDPTNFNLCNYDSLRIATSDTFLTWNYQWEEYNVLTNTWDLMPGETLPSITINSTNRQVGTDSAWFRLTTSYSNQFGIENCPYTTDSVLVIYYLPPTVSYIPGDSVGICPNDSVLFVAEGDFLTFSWEEGLVLGASRYINSIGLYPVEATGVNGCITYDTVTVYPLTINAAAGPDVSILSGEVATLSAFGGTDYRWWADKPLEFSDILGQTITVSKVLPDEVDNDTITIYVEVTSSESCSGIDSLYLYISRFIPSDVYDLRNTYNIITPDNNGLNDVWDITELMNGRSCDIVIMNRWGSTVYEQANFNGIWTGVDNGGNLLPNGTYYYILECDGTVTTRNAITIIGNNN